MAKLSKRFFCFFLIFSLFMLNLQSQDLNGKTSIQFHTVSRVLHTGDIVEGAVYFDKGFVISDTESAALDIFVPVSYGIDLQGTGVSAGLIILQRDLELDAGLTWTSGGRIEGRCHTIILKGNLTIPSGQDILFTSTTIIDGNGHDLILGHRAQLTLDSNVTLTFKNITLKNAPDAVTPYPVELIGRTSKLVFDNVELAPNSNITFSWGQLYIHNDVAVTGTSEFIYKSPQNCFIAPSSSFYFGPNTSFFYDQSTDWYDSTNMDLIVMQNKTSSLFIDGATIRMTDTGLRLTRGKLFLDNKVTLSSSGEVPQTFSNSLIFGNSALGSDYDLDVCILGAALVKIDGLVWDDSAA